MKKLIYISGPLVYSLSWLCSAFVIGNSHSIPYHKTFTHYVIIISVEILLYLLVSYLVKDKSKETKTSLLTVIALLICIDSAWRFDWFIHNDYRVNPFLYRQGLSGVMTIRTLEFIPLFVIILVTVFREKISQLLFGHFFKDKNAGD